jgi:ferritin-like metal-binding protein YciE
MERQLRSIAVAGMSLLINYPYAKTPTMALESLADAFYDELRDVLSAEKQLVKALPKMAKKASSDALREAFESHLEETKDHVERVTQAFDDTGKAARAKTCEAMEGLLAEASSMMEEDAAPEVMDAVLIGCAQKVEHYEIATYGTLCTWAKQLGYQNAYELLKENMSEEVAADESLTALSETINEAAESA